MTGIFKKSVLAATLAATALVSAAPAQADPYRGRRHNNGDAVGAAVLGGIIGLAIGVIASSGGKNKHRCDYDRNRDDRYERNYDERCYRDRDGRYGNYRQQGGYYGNYPQQDGSYRDDGRYADRDGRYEQDDDYREGRQGY